MHHIRSTSDSDSISVERNKALSPFILHCGKLVRNIMQGLKLIEAGKSNSIERSPSPEGYNSVVVVPLGRFATGVNRALAFVPSDSNPIGWGTVPAPHCPSTSSFNFNGKSCANFRISISQTTGRCIRENSRPPVVSTTESNVQRHDPLRQQETPLWRVFSSQRKSKKKIREWWIAPACCR